MKRLLLLSGKGGTGKTTVSAALIRLAGARAIADCDVDAPNLHLVMEPGPGEERPERFDFLGGEKARIDPDRCTGCGRCEAHCRFGAIRMQNGRAAVSEYSCEGCGVCAFLCPAKAVSLRQDLAGERKLYTGGRVFSTARLKMGRGNSGKLVTEVKLAMLKAAPACGLAIVDGSPGIGCPVIASVSGMDLVLVVAEPSTSGVSDLERLMKTAETFEAKLAVCVNKYDASLKHTAEIERFCSAKGVLFAGKIPFDPLAARAANEGLTVVDIDCPAGRAVRKIYGQVCKALELDPKAESGALPC